VGIRFFPADGRAVLFGPMGQSAIFFYIRRCCCNLLAAVADVGAGRIAAAHESIIVAGLGVCGLPGGKNMACGGPPRGYGAAMGCSCSGGFNVVVAESSTDKCSVLLPWGGFWSRRLLVERGDV